MTATHIPCTAAPRAAAAHTPPGLATPKNHLVNLNMSRRRFTLIELITVISVIILLSGLSMAAYSAIRSKGMKSQCNTQVRAIEHALNRYKNDHGYYYQKAAVSAMSITDFNALKDLNGRAYLDYDGLQFRTIAGNYVDPWGQPFYLQAPGTINALTFDIFSTGKDTKPGFAGLDDDGSNGIDDPDEAQHINSRASDDITNW